MNTKVLIQKIVSKNMVVTYLVEGTGFYSHRLKSAMAEESDRYHWIAYHLEAMNYGRTKVDARLSELPSSFNLDKADPGKLKEVIATLKELLKWYEDFIEYHQQKALSHIPETEKTKKAKKYREAENKSYENVFLAADEFK